jgi:hypothetical protein
VSKYAASWPAGFAAIWELDPTSAVGALLSLAGFAGAEVVSFKVGELTAVSALKGSLFSRARGAVSSTRLREIPAVSAENGELVAAFNEDADPAGDELL